MEELLKVIEQTFRKSSIVDLKKYLNNYANAKSYILISDYCIKDSNAFNDVYSFVILPEIEQFFEYQTQIKKNICKDLKNTTSISDATIKFLQKNIIFSINFIIPHSNNLILNKLKREDIFLANEKTLEMIDLWIKNEESKREYYEDLKKSYIIFNEECKKKNFNVNLYIRSFLLATLSAYITHQIFKFSQAMELIWFSDRDNMTSSNNSIIWENFNIQHNGISKTDNEYTERNEKIVLGISSLTEDCWFDELIKLPDYFAGSFAFFDYKNGKISSEKHKKIVNVSYKNCINIIIKEEKERDRCLFNLCRLKINE